MSDDSFADDIPWTKLALVGGGYLLLRQGIFGNELERRLKQQEKAIRDRIAAELQNPDSFTDSELLTHVETHKDIVVTTNPELPENQRVNVGTIEGELQGEPIETKALTWKTMAHRVTLARLRMELDENEFIDFFDNVLPGWLKNFLAISVAAASAAALIALLNRIIDFGRRGGGGVLDVLRDFKEIVRNGIFGSPDTVDDIEAPTPDNEVPVRQPDGVITGSPRGIGDILNLPDSVVAEIVNVLGIAADVLVAIGSGTVDLIVSVTTLTREEATAHPEWVLALALAIAAWAVLSAADGPLPVGDAAGFILVGIVATAIGVQFDPEGVRQIASSVRNDVTA